MSDITVEDNIFADSKTNRGSGSSNTTKTASTDNSSRHSNVSTAPSSADFAGQDEGRNANKKPASDVPRPPIPKSSSSTSFLKAAGRTFSFGGQKKNLPPVPSSDDPMPPLPDPEEMSNGGRARATTSSTSTTVTAPTIESNLDLGGDFSKMLGFDKRASVMTVRDDPNGRQAAAPRSLTATRTNQPSPIQVDKAAKVDPPPHSWGTQHSNDGLLTSSPVQASPTHENAPPPVPRHHSPPSRRPARPSASPELKRTSAVYGRRTSVADDVEGEDSRLLKNSLSAVNKFLAEADAPDSNSTSRFGRDDALGISSRKTDDENLFDNHLAHASRSTNRTMPRPSIPTRNKVMTPAQFERYRRDKERQDTAASTGPSAAKSDDEDNYEDDEDDLEKARQQAKQRRKQEAHMTVYRQQMMKVTGESANPSSSRPSLQLSYSTPNLPNMAATSAGSVANHSDGEDEDEEVPLAILAAHGFPGRNRAPARLSTMASNPNLRASQQPSYQRPGSVVGDSSGARGSRLPAFARNLPQDPFFGAGLVNNPVRESFALAGGAPAPGQPPAAPLPPGGLVGVIANEERSRAMRRGSPHIDNHNPMPPSGPAALDPLGGIPPHMMYQNRPASTLLSPADQPQMQMNQQMNQQVNQQMQQLIQMQMQFMQMMTAQGGANAAPRPNSAFMNPPSSYGDVGGMPGMGGAAQHDMMRQSFHGNGSMLDIPRGDAQMRTMSMVQPSSSSWIQPLGNAGYAPSIHIQGTGYTPSIAPSERSNIGLPGRYRPVSQAPPPVGQLPRSSTMPGALDGWTGMGDKQQPRSVVSKKPGGSSDDEDDEEGWQAMKAKREKKRSLWKTKKSISADISALIT